MSGTTRRSLILTSLQESAVPISGSVLAGRYSVSRQSIVQDISLLRAAGHDILSTTNGYLLKAGTVHTRVLPFTDSSMEQSKELLTTITDLGGWVSELTIAADSEKTLDLIERTLKEKQLLL